MKYKALINFCGIISMRKGEVREIKDNEIAKDLLNAKYIEKVVKAKKSASK